MARYINTYKGVKLPAHGKTQFLLANIEGTTKLPHAPSEYVSNLVCVVDNGPFQAAAYTDTSLEFDRFKEDGSGRPKDWIIVPGVAEFADQ